MEYIRKILYLNQYEEGTRGENAGFVRISKKQTRLKVEIRLTGGRVIHNGRVYLLVKDKNAVNKMFFSSVSSRKSGIELLREDIGKEKIAGDICGIILADEDGFVGAGTEDHSIDVVPYLYAEKVAAASENVEDVQETGRQEEPLQEEPLQDEPPQEEQSQEEPQPEKEMWEEPPQETEPQEEEEIIQVEIEEAHDEAYEFRKLFQNNPKMYPFEDDEMESCIQISPADFSNFPKEFWHQGSNTFLLQGYYNYRHLILAYAKEKLYVGIPGQFHRRDKYLAQMFGFGRFKGIHNKPPRLGDFGYWLMEFEAPKPVQEWCPDALE